MNIWGYRWLGVGIYSLSQVLTKPFPCMQNSWGFLLITIFLQPFHQALSFTVSLDSYNCCDKDWSYSTLYAPIYKWLKILFWLNVACNYQLISKCLTLRGLNALMPVAINNGHWCTESTICSVVFIYYESFPYRLCRAYLQFPVHLINLGEDMQVGEPCVEILSHPLATSWKQRLSLTVL